ncbi:hypothetical protein FAZ95_38490 [Trinickia violacea]|uniref:Uncharacterized protein n=1 Tax=Trinickia violacea TaxID=2571746 RepID=A0A4P8J443_9BURK|nr:hypothetical protein [Trinickia violacea]QCP54744.1 hypothetical protein FAZ95_38490 [Trinickia violacea]
MTYWSWAALGCAILLAALAVHSVLHQDRNTVFQLSPPMSTVRRLWLWWSCFWRQTLVVFPISAIAWMMTPSLALKVLTSMPDQVMHAPEWVRLVAMGLVWIGPIIVALWVVCPPLVGYVVYKAFDAHALATPIPFSFKHATLLGLTTMAWTTLGDFVVGWLTAPLPYRGVHLLAVLMYIAWGMYIVLPRQARRIAR